MKEHEPARARTRWLRRAAVVLTTLLVPGVVAAVNTTGKTAGLYRPRADAATAVAPGVRATAHDPAKPTVALLVNSKGANAGDLLGPYEVLASTGRVNTYVVSPGARLTPLTGGLDLVPDLTFDELARLLAERRDSLDAVVVPALRAPEAAELGAVNAWLRRQAADGALLVSVCAGARTLAGSGLLDGRPATSHWSRLPELREKFGAVTWLSGLRYVDDGSVISTAGVLSGIDGALRILERLLDADAAREAARQVRWRHHSPGTAARIPASGWEPSDAVVALNASYQVGPSSIGVRLTDGVGELELASAFASYTEQSMIGTTVAVGDGPVRSRHGLTFVPRSTVAAAAGGLDRLLVPGLDAARRRAAGSGASAATGGLRPEYLHLGEEFPFDPVLRDIARTYDVRTARFTAKTLEYPVLDVELSGRAWPWGATAVLAALLALGGVAAGAGSAVIRRLRGRRRIAESPGAAARRTGAELESVKQM